MNRIEENMLYTLIGTINDMLNQEEITRAEEAEREAAEIANMLLVLDRQIKP